MRHAFVHFFAVADWLDEDRLHYDNFVVPF